MGMTIIIIIISFLCIIETILPFIIKKTVVFGVSIPDEKVSSPIIRYYKKLYSAATFSVSALALILFYLWGIKSNSAEDQLVIVGLVIQFGIMLWSMSLYFYFHGKVLRLKREQQWYAHLKEVKVTALNLRQGDEMLPWYLFVLPIAITIGMIIFSLANYTQFPANIPIHWGSSGQPDRFAVKTPFSVISLLLVLLTMQAMFLGLHELTKKSGIKMNPTNIKGSKNRQLLYRKYTSWFFFLLTILITILFSFIQVITLYKELYDTVVMMVLPISFLLLVLAGSLFFAVKVGKLNGSYEGEDDMANKEEVVDIDEDHYWKGGLFYYNKNDPSVFVEKRFGIGWTMNFAHPIGYIMIVVPILVILLISFIS
ncbi:MAG: DUF5808 domain-containing protein [Bacillus sp. (in: firmicutes)]